MPGKTGNQVGHPPPAPEQPGGPEPYPGKPDEGPAVRKPGGSDRGKPKGQLSRGHGRGHVPGVHGEDGLQHGAGEPHRGQGHTGKNQGYFSSYHVLYLLRHGAVFPVLYRIRASQL